VRIAPLALVLAGCSAAWLPTTLFHVSLDRTRELTDTDWMALAHASPDIAATNVPAVVAISPDDWITWIADDEGSATLLRVRRTELGLEAQAVGHHHGPRVRPTLRALHVGSALVVVVESSATSSSTERNAWLYVEEGAVIAPLMLDGASACVRVRGEEERPLDRGWSRAAVQTATLDSEAGSIVVHEHESVREVATGRPEQAARSHYEVERARTLTLRAGRLFADRGSLFDERS
jgi:hypothetical protein